MHRIALRLLVMSALMGAGCGGPAAPTTGGSGLRLGRFARMVRWELPGRDPLWVVLLKGRLDGEFSGVFLYGEYGNCRYADATYEKTLGVRGEVLGRPTLLTLNGRRVLAYSRAFEGRRGGSARIALVQIDNEPWLPARRIEIPESSRDDFAPMGEHGRPWLEDIDNDGKTDVCYFDQGRLRCLTLGDSGAAVHLKDREAKILDKPTPPVAYSLRTAPEANGQLRVRITLRNLSPLPLVLTPPRTPILEGGTAIPSNYRAVPWPSSAPAAPPGAERPSNGPAASIPKPRCAVSLLPATLTEEGTRAIAVQSEVPPRVTLEPNRVMELDYLLPGVPGRRGGGGTVEIRIVGLARWGNLESEFSWWHDSVPMDKPFAAPDKVFPAERTQQAIQELRDRPDLPGDDLYEILSRALSVAQPDDYGRLLAAGGAKQKNLNKVLAQLLIQGSRYAVWDYIPQRLPDTFLLVKHLAGHSDPEVAQAAEALRAKYEAED